MTDVLQIPADLTPMLRRAAMYRYYDATERAQRAAVGCRDDEELRPGQLADFARMRVEVLAAEDLFELVGDDVSTPEPLELPLERGAQLALLVEQAIEDAMQPIDDRVSEAQLLAAADSVRQLRGLLAAPQAVTS